VIGYLSLRVKSISLPTHTQAGLAVVKAWLGHIGRMWCGSPADITACLHHSQQAVAYLLQVRAFAFSQLSASPAAA